MILSKLGVVMKSISKLILCILCVSACEEASLSLADGDAAMGEIPNDSQMLGSMDRDIAQEDAEMREVNPDADTGGSEVSDLEFIDMPDMNVGIDMEMLVADMDRPRVDMEMLVNDMYVIDMYMQPPMIDMGTIIDMTVGGSEMPIDMGNRPDMMDMSVEGAQVREVCEGTSDCAPDLSCLGWPSGYFCTPTCGYNHPASGLPSDPPCPAGYGLECHVSNSCVPALCRNGCDPGYECDDTNHCSPTQ